MKLLVIKFRANDLTPSYGKQIEFNPRISKDFFEFTNDSEKIQIIYQGLTPEDPNNGTKINVNLDVSPARGDYKIYQNNDGTLSLKQFFLERLNLTPDNIDDFFTLKESGDRKYELSYIPKDSEIGKYFTRQNLNSQIIGLVKDSATTIKINHPLQRIIFGAPGTGKSFKLNKDSESFYKPVDLSSKLKEEFFAINNTENYVPQCSAIGFKYGKEILEQFPRETKKEINTILAKEKDDPAGYYITTGAQTLSFLHPNQNIISNENSRLERVTFHPNYSYAQFVGTYKPVTKKIDEKEEIAYEYVPGPFMRIYTAAKQNPSQNFLLIIEEINRANVAAVFGDVFQLLDRDGRGNSEFPIAASEDIKKYLEHAGIFETELSIPSNMYIWATMNSADQGVMPMDAAFKRRWNFEYIGIDDNQNDEYEIPLPNNEKIRWNTLRKAINDKLKQIPGVNEDKLLGPYFISKNTLESLAAADEDAKKEFIKIFKSKVLMYLFEDVVKMRQAELFEGISEQRLHFSDICKAFDEKGISIFNFDKDDLNRKYPPNLNPART